MWGLSFMDELIATLERLKESLRPKNLFVAVMSDGEIGELIIKLNTGGPGRGLPTSQLWNGVDSTGKELESIGGPYAKATIDGTANFEGKREKNLPFDRVTLYNDGEYYDTWKVETEINGDDVDIIITSNPEIHGTNLMDRWSENIEGLTEHNWDIVRELFIDKAIKHLDGQSNI